MTTRTLTLTFPEDVVQFVPQQTRDTLESIAREALIVRLYDMGHMSSGQAARLLGITRWDFLDLLGHYHVSWFDDSTDVLAEAGYGQ
jgi:predicted HTH domain antitoxin